MCYLTMPQSLLESDMQYVNLCEFPIKIYVNSYELRKMTNSYYANFFSICVNT